MEDEGAEFLMNSEKIDEEHIITLQSVIRGSLVRKWIKEVRESFEDVVTEIEKNPNICVEWDKHLLPCLPKVYRKQQSKARKEVKDVKHLSFDVRRNKKFNETGTTICPGKVDKDLDTGAFEDLHTCTGNLFVNTENEKLELRSAETQTSFIEIQNSSLADWPEKDADHKLLKSHTGQTDAGAVRNGVRVNCDSFEDKSENIFIKSDDELLYEKEMSPSSETSLNLQTDIDHQGIFMTEQMDDELAYQSNQEISAKSHNRANELGDFVTEVEDFQPTDSERSRHSSISVTSNKSEKSLKARNESKKESDRSDKAPLSETDIDSHGSSKDKTGMDSDRSLESQKLQKYSDFYSHEGVEEIPQNERLDSARSQDSRKSGHSRMSQRSFKNGQGQERSVERIKSPSSDRSETSQRSQRSGASQKSSNSQQVEKSQKSGRSKKNDGIKEERRSRTAHSTPEREHDIMSPRPSSVSPVPLSQRQEEKVAQPFQRSSNQDSTTLTNMTSVWDSLNSFRESCDYNIAIQLPDDPDELRELRKNISMELLWVQQAIISRKNYLKLKNKM